MLEIDRVVSSRWVAGIVSLAVAILLAYLVHILVEKPTDAVRRRHRHTSDEPQQDQMAQAGGAVVLP